MKDTNYTYHLQQRIALAVSRMQISPCNSIIDFFFAFNFKSWLYLR
jgi:hypothetical protein